MRLELDAPATWVHVPTDLPTGPQAEAAVGAWADEVVAGLRRRRPDAEAERLDTVREFAMQARLRLLPGAAAGLLYLPEAVPIGLVVSIGVSEPEPIEGSLVRALLGDADLVGRPNVEPVEVPGVGSGISVRCVFAAAPGRTSAAGLAYLLQGDRATVRVMASPAQQELIAHAAASLAEIVASLRLVE
ncbi:hypothetical protein [Agromyces marinus]|uniref:Uncharacterized protein n=1 Tax=Agromyces marinus TaxID=1389020 RepID=A0ABM8H3X0_9MICO|nr:hypothetical protein [Agromyces marinus]UIP59457.1 hypothetical protein DSM26151_23640 [Agromyces marinus]BDZ55498.1 hypothetical protein GCM10025870_25710 [Agromyces marinus]